MSKKSESDYQRDLADIRSLMERSAKFKPLIGFSGMLAGSFALVGAYAANKVFGFNPTSLQGTPGSEDISNVIAVALVVLVLALGTILILSWLKTKKQGDKLWSPAARQLLAYFTAPLLTGGALLLILLSHGLNGLLAPISLVFYGLALYNAGRFSYNELKFLGVLEIGLGLAGCISIAHGVLFWAIGFGVLHVVYGLFMHFRYER